MSTFEDLLTPEQLAEELAITVPALTQWRYRGMGPVFVKEGRWVRYRRVDVEEWLESRVHTRTDQAAGPRRDLNP
ncbi:MAG: helix-turn-helix transcriptional regulator [Dietzia sp.]